MMLLHLIICLSFIYGSCLYTIMLLSEKLNPKYLIPIIIAFTFSIVSVSIYSVEGIKAIEDKDSCEYQVIDQPIYIKK